MELEKMEAEAPRYVRSSEGTDMQLHCRAR